VDSEFEFLSDGEHVSEDEDGPLPVFDSDPLDPLIALYKHVQRNPGDIDGWQRILEQAHPAGDKGLLALAYLGLASALSKAGEEGRARDAYRQLLAVDSSNPEALAALGEVAAEPASDSASPTIPSAPTSGGYIDLGAMILGDSGSGNTRWVVSATAPSGDESADFSRLLSQFKEQVALNLSVEDAEAHYDLGTAYKEMGLLDEAISEFQLALRAQPRNLANFEMLGQCFLDRGEPAAAVRTLERALLVPSQVEDDLLGIYYFLAKSQEAVGNPTAAKDFYERIFALDINFKDVTERLRNLR
jgi:tetratricopeptide (TPR) repeat protein